MFFIIRQESKNLQDFCHNIAHFFHLVFKCLIPFFCLSINTHRKPTAEFLNPLIRTSGAIHIILFCYASSV